MAFLIPIDNTYNSFNGHIYTGEESFTLGFLCYVLEYGEKEYKLLEGSVILALEIVQLPPAYHTQYQKVTQTDAYVELLTPSLAIIGANDNGIINVTTRVKGSYPGKWALAIIINGVSSPPFLFTIKSPVTALSILAQPTTGELMVSRNTGRILPTVLLYIYIYI